MKKIWMATCFLAITGLVQAQQTEGHVVYERTTQMQVRIGGMGDEMERIIPRTRTDKFEIFFAGNESLRRPIQEEQPDEEMPGTGGGLHIRTIAAGADDITYLNFLERRMVEQREFGTKKFLVTDSIQKLNWKLTGEKKTILGYACQQALAQRIRVRPSTTMFNGELKREEAKDTATITVWFTGSIPVPAGPEYAGQLPGLILEIDVNNGRLTYKALEVTAKTDKSLIKEPKAGKKVTLQEFDNERYKIMAEMQKNNQGRTMIRIGS